MKVGFIGLGDMGQGIVPRLIDAGHTVTGWNRTIEKAAPLLQIGMAWADSPRQVARRSEAVISIVTDAAAVREVALGDEGVIAGLRPGRGLSRHEHHRSWRVPIDRRRLRRRWSDHARRSHLGQPDHAG